MAPSDESMLDAPSTNSPPDDSLSDASDSPFHAFLDNFPLPSPDEGSIPIMVNSCTGKMASSVIIETLFHELYIIPVSFGSEAMSGQTYDISSKKFYMQGPSNREIVLQHLLAKYPDMIVVDYTLSAALDANVELYCKFGVPFVLGTNGGNRDLMLKTIQNSQSYALVSSQMGKQTVAFLGVLEYMSSRFPGMFAGYTLQVKESLDESKAKSLITMKAASVFFKRLGVAINMNQVESLRDPIQQRDVVEIKEEHLSCHEYYVFHLTSSDKMAHFEFQIKVSGRSMYAESTIDAVKFLNKKIKERHGKKLYNMLDVLRECEQVI
ncbi:4-hydroxy-tetrahydrodipicolinate reductase 2, chloroplastic-like [Senna tora]|uniref:4-hydroxy-tetrahydrodipicolinate reductase 2, chloroplastic-like n=1 Tax=Senna tora TaxID=362788 RepID=A0A834TP06_9FABA|nr:4-hydroxy-tetrahydrodipicolinate reductase 2, chloroplastic-like [Senna tora]